MTAAAPSIRLTEASKWYGDVLAVNEVSVEFGAGVTGLLGPNGAGKSTAIKMITGMLRPSLGAVRVCGADPFTTPALMRRVGLVPEQDAVYARSSALETTAYLMRLHGCRAKEARDRARAALERAGLRDAMHRSVAGYSKGMRQRAKLAQALAHDPDVLVLDEPMNGLDPTGRAEMAGTIRRLGEEGRCVLVSSHVLHEVESVASRILLMDHGRVVAQGTVAEIRGEMRDHPTAVRVRTTAPRVLAPRLVALDGVARVDLSLGYVDLLTTRPDDLFASLAALSAEGLPVDGYEPTDEGLDAVFRYLTTGKTA